MVLLSAVLFMSGALANALLHRRQTKSLRAHITLVIVKRSVNNCIVNVDLHGFGLTHTDCEPWANPCERFAAIGCGLARCCLIAVFPLFIFLVKLYFHHLFDFAHVLVSRQCVLND